MAQKKSRISVQQAVRIIYNDMPTRFHGIIFVEKVRSMTGRQTCFDGTIMRKLRELKKLDGVNYRIVDREISLYEKL
jgi:hypothetical protein